MSKRESANSPGKARPPRPSHAGTVNQELQIKTMKKVTMMTMLTIAAERAVMTRTVTW